MKKIFVEMCEEIHTQGMLKYESICEELIDRSDLPDDMKTAFQGILDSAQFVFENEIKL